jgi:energy-coupling factor transporter ATP-binding protein EcfA2
VRRRRQTDGVALSERLEALTRAVELGRGRLDPGDLDAAAAVIRRAGERVRLSGEHTVVALAGATGSGKSTLFNAIAGLDLSAVGVRRPTTSHAVACAWGQDGAGPLLDWLGVPRRHQLARDSVLDVRPHDDLAGLVLLDLPDHDSTEVTHRLEVDRLVQLVDMLVWVVDPQKYADAAIHERYLRPLAGHDAVTAVVLNQVDTLAPDQAGDCLADLRQLLAADGLGGAPVLAVSARTGSGLDELRHLFGERVAARRAATDRLVADVTRVATTLAEGCATPVSPEVGAGERRVLVGALADAAGVPVVGSAVERAHRYRAARATGWPPTRWLRRLRPDPLRRLHLGDTPELSRTSLPEPTPVQRSRVDTALRRVADGASGGLPPPWVSAVRRATRARSDDLSDALDAALAGTDLGVRRSPRWWKVAGALQWLFFAAAVIGLVWLGVLAGMAYLRLPELATPDVGALPLPTLLAVGGVMVGLLLALLSRALARVGGRRRRARAESKLRARVETVADELVVRPVGEELAAYGELCAAASRAAGR